MEIIKVIVRNMEFDVPIDVLMQFDFFEGSLEINKNDVIKLDVCPFTFKNMIDIAQNININENVCRMADMMGIKVRNELFNYKCNDHSCNNFAFKKNYCEIHICEVINCEYGKMFVNNAKYCKFHTCESEDCIELVITRKYCAKHTCKYENCITPLENNAQYCIWHKCGNNICTNKRVVGISSYCIKCAENRHMFNKKIDQ